METTSQQNDKVIKEFSGILSLKYHRGDADPSFAFVDDDYIHKSLLLKHNIDPDCHVKGKAVLEDDGKWKAFWLEIE